MEISESADTPLARRVVIGLTLFVVVAVAVALRLGDPGAQTGQPSTLATLNAVLNGASFVALLMGYYFVRRRSLRAHRAAMLSATGISSVFLITYLLHHLQVGSVKYMGQGLWRTLYFSLLIPHVVLAGVILPMALLTVYRGLTGRIPAHRRLARWTLPLWLFVSASGVAVYLMLYYT